MFTNRTQKDVEKFLEEYSCPEFANPGTVAITNVELSEGTDVFKGVASSNVDFLNKLGLDVEITNSKVTLLRPFLAAEKGKPLTVE